MISSFKKHILEHYLFYALVQILLYPLWLKITVLSLYKNTEVILIFLVLMLGNSMVFISSGLTISPQLKIISRLLLIVGLLIGIISLVKLFGFFSNSIVILLALTNILVLAWWTTVSLINITNGNREKNKLIGKKVMKYYILTAIMLYAPFMIFIQYYNKQIDILLNKSPALGTVEVEMLIDAKLWEIRLLVFVLIIITAIIFYFLCKKTRNNILRAAK